MSINLEDEEHHYWRGYEDGTSVLKALVAERDAVKVDNEKLRAENENLRKTIRDGIKLIDLDAVKSFRKTLKWALGEKE